MRLYMAHPFPTRRRMREWEKGIEERMDVELVNPFYDNERTDVLDIDAGRRQRYTVDPTKIVTHDVDLMGQCDGMFAYVDGSLSYGTIMEIVYMKERHRLPVYMVVSNGHDKHPWLEYHATEMFTSLGEFARWLKRKVKSEKG